MVKASVGTPDICSYLAELTQQMETQSLLAQLRNSQDYCTDSYCLDMLDREPDTSGYCSLDNHALTLMLVSALLAMILYLMRSSSARSNSLPMKKSMGNNPDNDDDQNRHEVL